MKTATISKDPFNLNDGTIRDEQQAFIVTRHKQGSSVIYNKTPNSAAQYKPFNMDYWGSHELCILNQGLRYRHNNPNQHCYMVKLKSSESYTQVGVKLQTKYAGITLHDWLRIKVKCSNEKVYQHPFCLEHNFLWLMSECVSALKQLTQMGIRHGDIKADNICIPFDVSYGSVISCWQDVKKISIELYDMIFIDFAFAISNDFPLQHSLPQDPHNHYSLAMQQALSSRNIQMQQALDWRVDVYSLGYLLNQVIKKEGMPVDLINTVTPLIEQMLNIENTSVDAAKWYDDMWDKVDALMVGECAFDPNKMMMSIVAIEGLEITEQAHDESNKPKPDDAPTFYKPSEGSREQMSDEAAKLAQKNKPKSKPKPQNANNSPAKSKVKAYWQALKNNQGNIFEWANLVFVSIIVGLSVYYNQLLEPTVTQAKIATPIPPDHETTYATIAQQKGQQYLKIGAQGQALADNATQWDCVYDSKTKLLWEEKTNDGGLRDKDWSYTWYNPDSKANGGKAGYQDQHDFDNTVKQGQTCGNILAQCNTLAYAQAVNQQGGICGYTNWQVPHIEDLYTLINCFTGFKSTEIIPTQTGGTKTIQERCKGDNYPRLTINLDFFANTQSSAYWSSSPVADNSDIAWIVFFGEDNDGYYVKNSNNYVRLVRSSQ